MLKSNAELDTLIKLLGEEYYVHTGYFIDGAPTECQYRCYKPNGAFISDDHFTVGKEEVKVFHKLEKTPNHSKSEWMLCTNNYRVKMLYRKFDTESDSYTQYLVETKLEKGTDYGYIAIEPGRDTVPYLFIMDAEEYPEFMKKISRSDIFFYDKYIFDSRENKISIEKYTIQKQDIYKVDNPLLRVKALLDKAKIETLRTTLNEKGEVISYDSDGICYRKTEIENSEFPIDFEEVIYWKSIENVVVKQHIYGDTKEIIVDTIGQERCIWESLTEKSVTETNDITFTMISLGKKLTQRIVDGKTIDSKTEDCESSENQSNVYVKDGKTRVDNPNGTYSEVTPGTIPGMFVVKTFNSKNEHFMTESYSENEKGGISIIEIGPKKEIVIKICNGITNTSLAYCGLNISSFTENGKISKYKDTFQEIGFGYDGGVFSFNSDVFEETDSYYIRNQYGIPRKYCSNILGFEL